MNILDLCCMKELIMVQKIQRELAFNELRGQPHRSIDSLNLAKLYRMPNPNQNSQPPQLNFLGFININNGVINQNRVIHNSRVSGQNGQNLNDQDPRQHQKNQQQLNQNQANMSAIATEFRNPEPNALVDKKQNICKQQSELIQIQPIIQKRQIEDKCLRSTGASSSNSDHNEEEFDEEIVDVVSVENDSNGGGGEMVEIESETVKMENEEIQIRHSCKVKSELQEENLCEKGVEKETHTKYPVEVKEEMIETSEMDEMIALELAQITKLGENNRDKGEKNRYCSERLIKDKSTDEKGARRTIGNGESIEKDKKSDIVCHWEDCETEFADDNQLYDHIKLMHICGEPIENEQNSGNDDCGGNSFGCKWRNCDLSPRRGNLQRKKNWLLNHIFVRHVPRAEIHLCLFVDCNLRFKKLKALTNHLNSAHVEQKRTKSTTENPENERKKFRSQKRCVLAGDEQLLMQNSDLNDNAGVPKRRGRKRRIPISSDIINISKERKIDGNREETSATF